MFAAWSSLGSARLVGVLAGGGMDLSDVRVVERVVTAVLCWCAGEACMR